MRLALPVGLFTLGVLACGCSLLIPLDDLAGPDASSCQKDGDCDPGLLCVTARCSHAASCQLLKQQRPETPDGTYALSPPGTPDQTLSAFCDMTRDGGGWMLVTSDMLESETKAWVTTKRLTNAQGGLVLTLFPEARCGEPAAYHSFHIKETIAWSVVRYKQSFSGSVTCWAIFGQSAVDNNGFIAASDMNLVTFEPGTDQISHQVGMGGVLDGKLVNAFSGPTAMCNSSVSGENFWANGGAVRSAEVILRRTGASPAGPGTGAACIISDVTSAWWSYDNVFVR